MTIRSGANLVGRHPDRAQDAVIEHPALLAGAQFARKCKAQIGDVTLRPQLLHHPGAHHVVELQETNIRTDNSIQVTTNKQDG